MKKSDKSVIVTLVLSRAVVKALRRIFVPEANYSKVTGHAFTFSMFFWHHLMGSCRRRKKGMAGIVV